MTQPSVREQLLADRPSPIWFMGVTTAFLVFIIITDGFAWGLFLVVPALMVIVFVVMQAGFWLNNYAIFHERYVDIRQVDWGAKWGVPELTIPYSAIRSGRVGHSELVELILALDRLPAAEASRIEKRIQRWDIEAEDEGPVLLLRAKDPYRLSAEFNRRIAAPLHAFN